MINQQEAFSQAQAMKNDFKMTWNKKFEASKQEKAQTIPDLLESTIGGVIGQKAYEKASVLLEQGAEFLVKEIQEATKDPKQQYIKAIVRLYNYAVNPINGKKPSCEEALTKFLANFTDANPADKAKLSKVFKGMYSAYNGEKINNANEISNPVTWPEAFKAFVREIIRICLVVPAVAKFVFGNDSDSFIRGYRSTRENKNDFAAGVGSFKDLVEAQNQQLRSQQINLQSSFRSQ